MYVCMYVCMYICMYVCMYDVCVCALIARLVAKHCLPIPSIEVMVVSLPIRPVWQEHLTELVNEACARCTADRPTCKEHSYLHGYVRSLYHGMALV